MGAATPGLDDAPHDARLLAWFQALSLARRGQAAESLPYFKASGAGPMLLGAGHATYHSDPACTVFNWILAYEIGPAGLLDGSPKSVQGYVDGLIANGQAQVVVEAYSGLLRYEPANAGWRLTLAKAYLALDQLPEAEAVCADPAGRIAGTQSGGSLVNRVQVAPPLNLSLTLRRNGIPCCLARRAEPARVHKCRYWERNSDTYLY